MQHTIMRPVLHSMARHSHQPLTMLPPGLRRHSAMLMTILAITIFSTLLFVPSAMHDGMTCEWPLFLSPLSLSFFWRG